MMKSPRQVNFDRIAPVYDLLAKLTFGKTIRKVQQHYLSLIPAHSRILIIGGGTGWILTDILSLRKNLQHITYLEASAAMLEQADKKLTAYKALHTDSNFPAITFIQGTEDNIPQHNFYDVVITNFFLDIFDDTELQEVMMKLSRSLHPEGIWLFSDFNICEKPMNAWWQRLLIRVMYWFFKMSCHLNPVSLPDFGRIFYQLGFIQTHSRYFFHDMMVTRIYCKADLP